MKRRKEPDATETCHLPIINPPGPSLTDDKTQKSISVGHYDDTLRHVPSLQVEQDRKACPVGSTPSPLKIQGPVQKETSAPVLNE
uniref:Protocadherin-9 n=1 Tax=Rhabditophanes sp. KR3021 TaxID=114890 RepID=A0AC35TYU8_9BILA